MDAVVTYHTNPWTCGIAKFNQILSERLGVPLQATDDLAPDAPRHPLVSINTQEFTPEHLRRLEDWAAARPPASFSVFFHALSGHAMERVLAARAATVFAGNREVAEAVAAFRKDVVEAWAPSLLSDPDEPRPQDAITVFSFGMAHKVRSDDYERLRDLLEATGKPYDVFLSTAVHSNTSLDGSFASVFEELERIFGPRVHFMGYLSDRAVHRYLRESTFLAAFFEKGLRANNTTVHAAMDVGSIVITNLDRHSPPDCRHLDTVLDIKATKKLPLDPDTLDGLRRRAQEAAARRGWGPLVERIRAAAPRAALPPAKRGRGPGA